MAVIIPKQENVVLNETSIQRMFKLYYGQNYKVIIPNFFTKGGYGFESDLMCVRQSGYAVEVEIKISESDYKNDFKKKTKDYKAEPTIVDLDNGCKSYEYPELTKHELLKNGRLPVNYFYYAMPILLAEKILLSLPEHVGLLAVTDQGIFKTLKCAPILHKNKLADVNLAHMATNLCHRYWDSLFSQDILRKENITIYNELRMYKEKFGELNE